jgi:hypothetical protein
VVGQGDFTVSSKRIRAEHPGRTPHGDLTDSFVPATKEPLLSTEQPDAAIGDPCSGRSAIMQSNRSIEPRASADHGGRQHQANADAGIAARRAHAAAVRRRVVHATRVERDLSRAARATTPVLHRPAPHLVSEGSPESTPLFTRHTRGTIEAERDRRRQRRADAAVAYRDAALERAASASHPRITAAVAGNARAVTEARLDMDPWIDEGGTLPFEAAAALGSNQGMKRCSS